MQRSSVNSFAPPSISKMLDIVRILSGSFGLAGLIYLFRQLPPLLAQYASHQARVGGAKRYRAWRGSQAPGPDLLDQAEGQIIVSRLKRLAGVGVASIIGVSLALFPPLS